MFMECAVNAIGGVNCAGRGPPDDVAETLIPPLSLMVKRPLSPGLPPMLSWSTV
jgi:hypothetical protein